jgi:hypothetical protein
MSSLKCPFCENEFKNIEKFKIHKAICNQRPAFTNRNYEEIEHTIHYLLQKINSQDKELKRLNQIIRPKQKKNIIDSLNLQFSNFSPSFDNLKLIVDKEMVLSLIQQSKNQFIQKLYQKNNFKFILLDSSSKIDSFYINEKNKWRAMDFNDFKIISSQILNLIYNTFNDLIEVEKIDEDDSYLSYSQIIYNLQVNNIISLLKKYSNLYINSIPDFTLEI